MKAESLIAFMGLPWPMKITGMRRCGLALRAVWACTCVPRVCSAVTAAQAPVPCSHRRRERLV